MGDHLCIGPDVLAIWTGAGDLGPVDNPSSHPTRVKFNSKQENIGFHKTPITGTYNTGSNWGGAWGEFADNRLSLKITLSAHGLPYRPFLLGWVRLGSGPNLPINGSIMDYYSGTTAFTYSYTIGVDQTNVYLNVLRVQRASGISHLDGPPANPQIHYSIWLSNYGVNANGSLRRPPYFNGVEIRDDQVPPRIRAGYFDTDFLYPYQDNAGPIAVADGETISNGIGMANSGPTPMRWGYRYSVLGHIVQRNMLDVSGFSGSYPGATGNNASFVASVTRLSL